MTKPLVLAWLLLSVTAHAGDIQWGGWQLMRDCHGAHYEFRVSTEPANERVAFRVTNRSGEPFATNATVKVRRDDGSWAEIRPLVAGTPPTGGYEGWVAPDKTVELGEFDVAAPNPHPITGERPAGSLLEVGTVSVMTQSRHKAVIAKRPPGAYFSMKDGEQCDKSIVIPFGWQTVVGSQKTADGHLMRLRQEVTFAEDGAKLSIRLQVRSDEADVYTVTANIARSTIKQVSMAEDRAQPLPFGTYWCVRVDCTGKPFKLAASDGQAGTDNSGLLYFRSRADAEAAVHSLGGRVKG